jgi:hypothetical protein
LFQKYSAAYTTLPRNQRGLLAGAAASLVLALGVAGYAALPGGSAEEAPLVLASPTPAPTASPFPEPTVAPTAPPTPVPTPMPPPLSDSTHMVIERIGVSAPVSTFGLDANAVPIVPTGPYAGGVVAWYDFSARPGTGGNSVYAGHVTWNGAAVFYYLSSLGAGDLIRIRDDRGAEVVYRVVANDLLDVHTTLQKMYPVERDLLTIVTCGGSFYSTGDPTFGGEYTSRTVIQAELVGITRV